LLRCMFLTVFYITFLYYEEMRNRDLEVSRRSQPVGVGSRIT
jgi:hypothetical protein